MYRVRSRNLLRRPQSFFGNESSDMQFFLFACPILFSYFKNRSNGVQQALIHFTPNNPMICQKPPTLYGLGHFDYIASNQSLTPEVKCHHVSQGPASPVDFVSYTVVFFFRKMIITEIIIATQQDIVQRDTKEKSKKDTLGCRLVFLNLGTGVPTGMCK